MKISEIAKIFNLKVENLKEDIEITSVSSLNNAKEGSITFIAEKKHIKEALNTKASAIITFEYIKGLNIPQLISENPKNIFYKLIDILYKEEDKISFISKTAVLGQNVKIGKNVYIGDYVVIEDNVKIGNNTKIYPFTYIGKNTKIGENSVIYPRVSIYKDTTIGKNVIIHSGAVIASDGFGYYREEGQHKKIKHIGKVIIEDNVEIGANTTIDRAMLDETIIKEGTKIDNLVMIAHNVVVGKNTILVSQVGIAGSCKIGNNCILAGQVGIADHINIADNVIITAKSGVGKNIEKAGIYGANIPAIEWSKWRKILMYLYKLPELVKKLSR
ncbi:MAG TPA: UDP-3-O-(3-hydroxymyristoyl)glucosamine N-acyltransferase [Persephonella sp.]|nr:UDP-3-O-(3-hydroxymyristoyl)glucosamine N-acyltransferase [Hydrogenothermaceae bacterium]HIQ24438.1 UDP-3-O-(3-hydroxymyristoyl)glucosamine N-acyltransferase [Persephonella sp.]